MPRLKMLRSLGTEDRKKYADGDERLEGEVYDFDDDAARELQSKQLAEPEDTHRARAPAAPVPHTPPVTPLTGNPKDKPPGGRAEGKA